MTSSTPPASRRRRRAVAYVTHAARGPSPTRARRLPPPLLTGLPPREGALVVFDASGRKVRTLASRAPAGCRLFPWDGRDDAGRAMPQGLYFAHLLLNDGVQMRRIALLR